MGLENEILIWTKLGDSVNVESPFVERESRVKAK